MDELLIIALVINSATQFLLAVVINRKLTEANKTKAASDAPDAANPKKEDK